MPEDKNKPDAQPTNQPVDEPSKNPFIRWKRHIDEHVSATLHNIIGLPSAATHNLSSRWPDVEDARRSQEQTQQPAHHPGTHSFGRCGVEHDRPVGRYCPMGRDAGSGAGGGAGNITPGNTGSDNNGNSDDPGDSWKTWPDWVQMARWHGFAYSPYCPLNIRSLPPPRPLDLVWNEKSNLTFEDAFEDLLTIMSGRPLPPINEKVETRKLLSTMFPTGEPSFYWIRRLQSCDLLDALFPRAEQVRMQLENRNQTEDEARRERELNDKRGHMWKWVWNRHHPSANPSVNSDSKSFEEWDLEDWAKEMDSILSQAAKDVRDELSHNGNVFSELDRIFKAIGRVGDSFSKPQQEGKVSDLEFVKPETPQDASPDAPGATEPDTEEDYFSALARASGSASASASASTSTNTHSENESQHPFDTWKSVWDQRADGMNNRVDKFESTPRQRPVENSTTEENVDPQTGIRTIKTTEEKIDPKGNRTIRTEIRQLNAHGEEISRSSSYSKSMSASWSWSSKSAGDSGNDNNWSMNKGSTGSTREDDKKPGWFWK